jgi:predicted MFS family arabinose efflux permease
MTTTIALSRPTLFTRAFVLLAAADLAYFTADGIAIYALPLYVTGPIGSDEAGAGLAFGAFAISALILRPFAGRLSDMRGRRPLLLAGAGLCVVGMVLTAFVGSLAYVVAARLLLGVGEAAFFVASIAALVDIAPPDRIGEAMSYNSLGLYLGLALGPPLGEVLVGQGGFVAAWLGAAGLGLISVLTVLRLPETRVAAPDPSGPAPLIHWKVVPIALGFLTSIVAMGGFLAFASLHAVEVGLRAASLPLFTYGAVVVVGRIAFAKVMDRVPSLPLGAGALTAMAAGLTVVAAWSSPAGVIVGAMLLGLGVTFSTPAFFSAIFGAVRPSERGAASGTATAFIDLGLGGGPILLGLVASAATIPLAFVVAAAVALLGAVWTLSLRRGSPRAA